jgi:hypothetical protein
MDNIDGVNDLVYDNENAERKSWKFCDKSVSRSLLVFMTQVIVATFMIVFSCFNLYVSSRCEETTIWIAILSSAVGYFLPNPKL